MNDPDASPTPEDVAPDCVSGERGRPDWRIWLGLTITVGWLLLGAAYIGHSIGWSRIGDQPADTLGNFLEGAFAPLAFLWLVIGYFLQQKELGQNTQALRLQFTEIQRTAEQAVRQTETIARSEIHARQATFLEIGEQVRRQLGAIAGLLWISSQGATEEGPVPTEEMADLWSQLNMGDPDVFSRRMLETHSDLDDPEQRYALFYGTEIRARHANNLIFTFERLVARARDADTDGILADSVYGSAHGFVYRLAVQYRALAPPELADVDLTGRDIRLGMLSPGSVRTESPPATATGAAP